MSETMFRRANLFAMRLLSALVAFGALAGGMACAEAPVKTLRVGAASSLTDVFTTLGQRFEALNPGVHVAFTFAGSQTLRVQIAHGAPIDVFASADAHHIVELSTAGHVGPAVPLVKGMLVVIAPSDNPAGLKTFRDLPNAQRIVVGSPASPIGAYTQAALANAGAAFAKQVRTRIVSEESNVRLVRAKVELGEADAAIVYRSDVPKSSRLIRIALPQDVAPPVQYLVAPVLPSPRTSLQTAWLDFLQTAEARAAFTHYGFVL